MLPMPSTEESNFTQNTLSRTLLDGQVRAATVHLDSAWLDILGKRSLPPTIASLLGELCAASALLAATLKFNGSLVLQLQGDADAPVALMVVECNAQLNIRAAVKLREGAGDVSGLGFMQLLNPSGMGRFIVVLDPLDKLPGQQAYTSLVPLLGHSVAESLDYYMAHSEQLPTRLILAADANRCAGLLIQKMPVEGGKQIHAAPEAALLAADQTDQDDVWTRARHYINTVKTSELLQTDAPTLMHRLFWDESPTPFELRNLRFACACSRAKVGKMLTMLGQAEVAAALSEQEKLAVNCDFCDQNYAFDAVDCAALFSESLPTPSNSQLH